MRPRWLVAAGLMLAGGAWGQNPADEDSPPRAELPRRQPGPGRQIANGAGNIGVGAAKGAGHLALGAAKGAGNLVTLHPVDAAVSVGKGAVEGGKDATVGAVKGSAKIGKGIGRGLKRIL
jgi:hypothetical protein